MLENGTRGFQILDKILLQMDVHVQTPQPLYLYQILTFNPVTKFIELFHNIDNFGTSKQV